MLLYAPSAVAQRTNLPVFVWLAFDLFQQWSLESINDVITGSTEVPSFLARRRHLA